MEKAGPEDDVYALLEKLEEVVKEVRTGGLIGGGPRATARRSSGIASGAPARELRRGAPEPVILTLTLGRGMVARASEARSTAPLEGLHRPNGATDLNADECSPPGGVAWGGRWRRAESPEPTTRRLKASSTTAQ